MSIFGDNSKNLSSVTSVLVDVKLCPFSGTNEFKQPAVFVSLILVINMSLFSGTKKLKTRVFVTHNLVGVQFKP